VSAFKTKAMKQAIRARKAADRALEQHATDLESTLDELGGLAEVLGLNPQRLVSMLVRQGSLYVSHLKEQHQADADAEIAAYREALVSGLFCNECLENNSDSIEKRMQEPICDDFQIPAELGVPAGAVVN